MEFMDARVCRLAKRLENKRHKGAKKLRLTDDAKEPQLKKRCDRYAAGRSAETDGPKKLRLEKRRDRYAAGRSAETDGPKKLSCHSLSRT